MISRRDKLLVRPWEQRRYEYHRRKVQSAIPAIDVGPPANHNHVSYKVKKHQKEIERCDKIEKDNLKLLQRLRNVMTSTRIDNTWTTAQPNFLNKVAIYDSNDKLMYRRKQSHSVLFDDDKSRKGRCFACTPKKLDSPKIPEERIPWEPAKPPVSRRRSQSVPSLRVQNSLTESSKSFPRNETFRTSSSIKPVPVQKLVQPKLRSNSSRSSGKSRLQTPMLSAQSSKSILLSRGDMHLALSFPPDTMVKLKNGNREKFLIDSKHEICHCKSMRS